MTQLQKHTQLNNKLDLTETLMFPNLQTNQEAHIRVKERQGVMNIVMKGNKSLVYALSSHQLFANNSL